MKATPSFLNPPARNDGSSPFTLSHTRFAVHSRDEIRIILFDDVICCIADGNYTTIYLQDGSKCMICRTLKDVEGMLYPSRFFRIHASYLVNLNYIRRILKSPSYRVELPFNLMLDISRSRQKLFLQYVDSMCKGKPATSSKTHPGMQVVHALIS